METTTSNVAKVLTVAGGNEVGHAAGLEEGAELAAGVEDVDELDHLHEAQADDGRLGVVAEAQPVHEAGAHGHDVLGAGHADISQFIA